MHIYIYIYMYVCNSFLDLLWLLVGDYSQYTAKKTAQDVLGHPDRYMTVHIGDIGR